MSSAAPAVGTGKRAGGTAPEPGTRAEGEAAADERDRGRWPGILVWALLGLILVAGLWIRLRHNGYGLPFVYNYDEAEHFTNRAVGMFGGDLDPGYYQNPSGYTYLIYAGLRIWFGILPFDLDFDRISLQFEVDPTPIWEFARTLTALLAMAGVVGTFFLARRFYGARVALVAAAILAFAFLPVTYSRIAVTDVGTFLPVAIAIWAILLVYERGRLVHYLVAGAAIGLAVGFKYTAGLALVPLLIAAGVRFWRDRDTPLLGRRDLRYLVAAGVALTVAFAITTPYFFVHPVDALWELKEQAEAAGDSVKLGQEQEGGLIYYLKSFGWGFGWAAIVFAAVGAVLELRRDRMRGILLISFPVALYLYMGTQTRYFGRWLLMIYPILALLAGIGIVRLAELVRGRSARHGWALSGALAAVIAALVLIQPVAADIRTSNVLGRDDTRQLARDWLVENYKNSLRVVIEPAVPDIYYRQVGRVNAAKNQFVRGFVTDLRRTRAFDAPVGADTTYASTLSPETIDTYRGTGFCLVMTNSLIRGRAENAQVPQALAYYQRLERESEHLIRFSPFKPGAEPVPLHYDFSFNHYPTAYERPGGIVDVYRLDDCKQKRGRVPSRPYGVRGLEKGIETSLPPK
jgi:hypothetical protein